MKERFIHFAKAIMKQNFKLKGFLSDEEIICKPEAVSVTQLSNRLQSQILTIQFHGNAKDNIDYWEGKRKIKPILMVYGLDISRIIFEQYEQGESPLFSDDEFIVLKDGTVKGEWKLNEPINEENQNKKQIATVEFVQSMVNKSIGKIYTSKNNPEFSLKILDAYVRPWKEGGYSIFYLYEGSILPINKVDSIFKPYNPDTIVQADINLEAGRGWWERMINYARESSFLPSNWIPFDYISYLEEKNKDD